MSKPAFVLLVATSASGVACLQTDFPTACAMDHTRCADAATDSSDSAAADTAVVDSTPSSDSTTPDVGDSFGPDTAVCVAGGFFCIGKQLRQCSGDGQSSSLIDTCTTTELCAAGGASGCKEPACTPGQKQCDGNTIQTCNAGQTGWDDGAACAAPTTCGGGGTPGECGGCGATMPGPTMVAVDGFCVDSTEVTQSQYQAFLSAKGSDTSGQPAQCASNASYSPKNTFSCQNIFQPSVYPNLPVSCIDWCDAYAYCAWAGKRVCGKIGGGSVAMPTPGNIDGSTSQWEHACSNGGTTTYPYGNSYVTGKCVDSGFTAARDVGSFSFCHGTSAPYSLLFDMSGNVAEWEDACLFSQNACLIRGGSYQDSQPPCTQHNYAGPVLQDPTIGIRCCAL